MNSWDVHNRNSEQSIAYMAVVKIKRNPGTYKVSAISHYQCNKTMMTYNLNTFIFLFTVSKGCLWVLVFWVLSNDIWEKCHIYNIYNKSSLSYAV